MSQPVKRACDACHRRKVKCDGIRPCKNCGAASLDCTYFAIPQKKGPKGSRAKVISELRETQRQTSLLAKVQSRMQTASMGGLPAPDPTSQTTAMTPGLLTPEVLKDCIDFYFKNVFPLAPILSRQRIENQAQFAEQTRDKDAYCLLTSLCAFILLQPGMGIPSADPSYPAFDMLPGANIIASQILVEETLRVRRGYEYLDSLSVDSVCTSYFLFACHYFMESHNKAWFNLREATTMAHMMELHKEEKYANMPVADAARQRRVYWHLFATERAYAIKRGRPLTLQATINPPSITDDPNEPLAHNLSNFVSMVNLFRPFDDNAAATWSKTMGNLQQGQTSGLQKQLHETVRQYINQDQSFADMSISRSWLEWQLNNGLGNNNNRAGFEYSNELAREMVTCMAQQFRGQEMDVSNSGLIQKLMGLTFHLFDFLSAQPPSRDLSTTSPQEHLSTLTNMVALIRLNDYRFVPLLLSKVHDILPRLISPLLDSAPEDSPMANFDIFDGFGNSTISYMQPQMHMAMDMDQDRKFSVADYENMSPSVSDSASASGSGPANGIPTSIPATVPTPTSVDMGSQYVTSPAATLMSPTVDYSHGLDFAACTPISEVVMSPLGHGPNGLGHSGAIHQQQTQQQQHHLLQNHGLNPQQLHSQNIGHNGLGQAQAIGAHQGMPGGTLPSHPMMGLQRQGPQRAGSFAMPHSQHHQPPPIPRTVGDFQALQRANSDSASMGQLAGMASLGPEMDFGGLR